jgi:hypothetical protein
MRFSYVQTMEKKRPGGPPVLRRRILRVVLMLEAAEVVFVFAAGFGLAILAAFVVLLAVGLVLAGLCSLGKPRYQPAVISLYTFLAPSEV